MRHRVTPLGARRRSEQEGNPSRRLYERAGFRVMGRIPQVHGDEAGLIYWRALPDTGSTV